MAIDRSKYTGTPIILFYKDIIEDRIFNYKEYMQEHFGYHNDKSKELSDILKNIEGDHYATPSIEDNIYKISTFTDLMLKSMIVTLYSELEQWVHRLADYTKMKRKIENTYKNERGKNDLHKCVKYIKNQNILSLDNLIDGTTSHTHWNIIIDFEEIRHCIVHQFSCIKHRNANEQNLLRIIKESGRIELGDYGFFTLSDVNYPLRFADQIQFFLVGIIDKLNKEIENERKKS